jgi:hypothetical protein
VVRSENHKQTVAVLVALVVGAGAAQAESQDSHAWSDVGWDLAQPVDYTPYEEGMYGECAGRMGMVANNPKEWDEKMQQLQDNNELCISPGRSSKDVLVDWKRCSVVLVAMGQRPDNSLRLQVHSVKGRGNRLRVSVSVVPTGYSTSVMCSPYEHLTNKCAGWKSVELVYVSAPTDPTVRRSASGGAELSAAGASSLVPVPSPVSWGKLKAAYR